MAKPEISSIEEINARQDEIRISGQRLRREMIFPAGVIAFVAIITRDPSFSVTLAIPTAIIFGQRVIGDNERLVELEDMKADLAQGDTLRAL